ncbi:MAG TPA: UDP-N-acetylmuramate dehydrogenase [Porticoccaceae bacterium]
MEPGRWVSLQDSNTLALPGRAEYLCRAADRDVLLEALVFARHRQLPVTMLGGGSNIVLTGDICGLVVRLVGGTIEQVPAAEVGDAVLVRVGAGIDWHTLVTHCLEQGWHGLENLALIPGTVGAAPIQNIGAYGVELADCFHSLEAVDLVTGESLHFTAEDCRFAYRDSIFKRDLKGRVAITSVTLSLSTQPRVCLDYPELRSVLAGCAEPTPRQVYDAVCALRCAKLPDPAHRPNAGSFFKNPVIGRDRAEALRAEFPDMPGYPQPDGLEKIPAAWLIDRAGWKGRRVGAVGVHDRQALVLVHFGGGSGRELLGLAAAIAGDVRQRFGIDLELEPVVLGDAADPADPGTAQSCGAAG